MYLTSPDLRRYRLYCKVELQHTCDARQRQHKSTIVLYVFPHGRAERSADHGRVCGRLREVSQSRVVRAALDEGATHFVQCFGRQPGNGDVFVEAEHLDVLQERERRGGLSFETRNFKPNTHFSSPRHLYYNSPEICSCSPAAGCNSCSIVSGHVSNCSYRLTVHPVTSARLSSA